MDGFPELVDRARTSRPTVCYWGEVLCCGDSHHSEARQSNTSYSRMQELYSPSIEDFSPGGSTPSERKKPRWFSTCREEPFTVHKSVSEASMYRANSRFSLKSESMSSKTLDYLMQCFWICSTGCHQTT